MIRNTKSPITVDKPSGCDQPAKVSAYFLEDPEVAEDHDAERQVQVDEAVDAAVYPLLDRVRDFGTTLCCASFVYCGKTSSA